MKSIIIALLLMADMGVAQNGRPRMNRNQMSRPQMARNRVTGNRMSRAQMNRNKGRGNQVGRNQAGRNQGRRTQLPVKQFDYIVVGAGPAGSMTAMGLAEKGFKTLLMEAGPNHMSANISTPALHVQASEDPNIAWDFHVKHYAESTKLRQRVLYPRVGGLGGCTLHNAMIHILPNKEDFESMVKLTGDKSWGEKNMRRYYNKIVRPTTLEHMAPVRALNQLGYNFQNLTSNVVDMFSSKSKAWLKLSRVNVFNLLSLDTKLLDLTLQILGGALTMDMLGFDVNAYNMRGQTSVDKEGSFLVPINVDVQSGMKRYGIYERIQQVRNKIPLTIWTDTLATNILLDNKNQAYGIKYLKGRHLYRAGKIVSRAKGIPGVVRARKEVIVSGGTFNTPQLMMLSGIGDPDHISKFGIKPRVNLPGVGRNLHDRYEISVNIRFNQNFAVLNACTFKTDSSDPCFKQFSEKSSGPYTFNGILSGTTVKSSPTLSVPDLFFLAAPIYFAGYHEGMGNEVLHNKDVFTMLALKAHSHNRGGHVRLRSANPRDVPDINFKYFEQGADKDLPALIKAVRDIRKKFSSFTSGYKEFMPGPHVKSDKQISDYIVKNAWGHHATGTMKMGESRDPMGVLDGKFRVKGTKKLRVVDMSIFSNIPGYFPVLYLYLVGAKAADTIASNV